MPTRPEELWQGGSLTLTCPEDGTALFVNIQPVLIGDNTVVRIGHHVHIGFNARATCAKGHKWKIEGEDLTLELVR